MSEKTNLLALIEQALLEFKDENGEPMRPRTFGRLAVNDTRFVFDLRADKPRKVRDKTRAKVLAFIEDERKRRG